MKPRIMGLLVNWKDMEGSGHGIIIIVIIIIIIIPILACKE